MRKLTNVQTIILGIFIGIVFMILYSILIHAVIEPWLIPHACYFHNHETTFLVNLFFDFPSYEGNHPVPSKLGFAFSFGLGLGLSYLFKKPSKS